MSMLLRMSVKGVRKYQSRLVDRNGSASASFSTFVHFSHGHWLFVGSPSFATGVDHLSKSCLVINQPCGSASNCNVTVALIRISRVSTYRRGRNIELDRLCHVLSGCAFLVDAGALSDIHLRLHLLHVRPCGFPAGKLTGWLTHSH